MAKPRKSRLYTDRPTAMHYGSAKNKLEVKAKTDLTMKFLRFTA